MKYKKINTLWKRDMDNNALIIEGNYSEPEFENIINWNVTEKLDGTNIRVYWVSDTEELIFKGRTDNSKPEEQGEILQTLNNMFDKNLLKELFPNKHVLFYGEGLDPKISKYCKDLGIRSFVCFDIVINGFWCSRKAVKDICKKLNIHVVPEIGNMSKEQIINYIKLKPYCKFAYQHNKVMISEGVVCRPEPILCDTKGVPITFKLKVRDYNNLNNTGWEIKDLK